MKRIFIELPQFKDFIDENANKELLKGIQEEISANPKRGDLIRGTGGVRKERYRDLSRGKGKRGGLRYLFLDLPDAEKTYLIGIYNKGVRIDISSDEKKGDKRACSETKNGGE